MCSSFVSIKSSFRFRQVKSHCKIYIFLCRLLLCKPAHQELTKEKENEQTIAKIMSVYLFICHLMVTLNGIMTQLDTRNGIHQIGSNFFFFFFFFSFFFFSFSFSPFSYILLTLSITFIVYSFLPLLAILHNS